MLSTVWQVFEKCRSVWPKPLFWFRSNTEIGHRFRSHTKIKHTYVITGNGKTVYLLKVVWQNSWNDIKWIIFWRILAIWNYCGFQNHSGGFGEKRRDLLPRSSDHRLHSCWKGNHSKFEQKYQKYSLKLVYSRNKFTKFEFDNL